MQYPQASVQFAGGVKQPVVRADGEAASLCLPPRTAARSAPKLLTNDELDAFIAGETGTPEVTPSTFLYSLRRMHPRWVNLSDDCRHVLRRKERQLHAHLWLPCVPLWQVLVDITKSGVCL